MADRNRCESCVCVCVCVCVSEREREREKEKEREREGGREREISGHVCFTGEGNKCKVECYVNGKYEHVEYEQKLQKNINGKVKNKQCR